VITDEFAVKWYLFWDALTRHRTDGSLMRLITPLVPPRLGRPTPPAISDLASDRARSAALRAKLAMHTYALHFGDGRHDGLAAGPRARRLESMAARSISRASRKVHATPIPRVGGLAMAGGVLVAALLTIRCSPGSLVFVCGAMLIVFGALDDRFDLNYRVKLLGQLFAVGVVVILGGRADPLSSFARTGYALPSWVSVPLTVIFLVGITNAINLADGLDGLAGGTTFLCLCARWRCLSSVGDPGSSTALALAFAGAVLGFLRFNTYPASVFMGDAGSQLLGFAVGVLSVRATQSATSQISAALPDAALAIADPGYLERHGAAHW
jgi:UDP-N-acetylmuramyl pentapeptide phosphotransferase/UDP-N-acetylglucosamine-1-phosphate transferase